MASATQILITYGYLLLFAWVLVEQLGIPLPATPILLAAGALSAEGKISFSLALLAALAGSLTSDSAWFLIGRKYGHHVLRILCKLSMEPTICVRRTQDSFGRRRQVTLMIVSNTGYRLLLVNNGCATRRLSCSRTSTALGRDSAKTVSLSDCGDIPILHSSAHMNEPASTA